MRISQRFHFDAAHLLTGYKGPCKCIHGHRYFVEFTFEGVPDSMSGLVVDFKKIKNIVGEWLDFCFDHALLLNENHCGQGGLERPLLDYCESHELSAYVFENAPTVENIAQHIWDNLPPGIDCKLVQVQVWETPECSAIVTEGTEKC